MTKEVIFTDNAPKPVGPYSQAVRANGFLYISGQLGIDPAKGTLASGGVEAEAALALPLGARVEVEAVAVLPSDNPSF